MRSNAWRSRWLWLTLLGAITAGLLVAWLLYPAPIVPKQVVAPRLRGVPTDQAVADLAAIGLRGRISGELEDPLTPSGTVSWQSPAAGTRLPQGSIVRLGISAGAPRVLVPDLVELDPETAGEVLAAAGLVIGRMDSVWSASPVGAVVRTRPEARAGIRAGTNVDLIVSKGPRGVRQ